MAAARPGWSTSTSTAYPKGSPARTTVKRSSQSPTFAGFSRSSSSTTVNGVITGQSSSTKFESPGGGGILGPLLIVGGLFMLWVVFKGKSGAMWNALTGDTTWAQTLDKKANAISPPKYSSGSSSSSGGSKSSAPVSGNTSDSGTHMGIDSSGNIITINSSYGDMTPSQKDAANAYAHQIGNV